MVTIDDRLDFGTAFHSGHSKKKTFDLPRVRFHLLVQSCDGKCASVVSIKLMGKVYRAYFMLENGTQEYFVSLLRVEIRELLDLVSSASSDDESLFDFDPIEVDLTFRFGRKCLTTFGPTVPLIVTKLSASQQEVPA